MRNACNSLITGSCPVSAGQPLTIFGYIPVQSDFFGGALATLTVTIYGDGNIALTCTKLDIVIW